MMKNISPTTKKYFIGALVVISPLLLNSSTKRSVDQNIEKEEPYRNGMVVSAHPEATKVGISILRRGGNAMDAAVAVHFALAVVYPNAGNLGGGGFMVYRSQKGEIASLDFREQAPEKATRDMFLDSVGNVIPNKSLYSHLAVAIPGSVAGMFEAHKKYGKLSWSSLIHPAVQLANGGFKITLKQAAELNAFQADFKKYNSESDYLSKKMSWAYDDLLIQKDLARTLERIRDLGRDGFYKGLVAGQIVSQMQRGGGIISFNDLENYQPIWRNPLVGKYKGYNVITMGPPSSGGIVLLQLLQAVEQQPLKRWGHNADSTVQFITEIERRVFADRATHLGDPDFYTMPEKQLLDPNYLTTRMANFSWNKATPSSEVVALDLPIQRKNPEKEQTTHFSIVDKEGNAVSVTTTLNDAYGSRIFVRDAGFLLNNEMDDFSAKPGSPNKYGVTGGEINSIEPNKRMLSSMTPTIIEKNGKLCLVLGSPGGSTIMTSVFQTILNVLVFNKSMQEAVSLKRFHHQWLPDQIFIETEALNSSVREKLEKKGYKIVERAPIGRVDAILVTEGGMLKSGADPRGDDLGLGL